MKEQEKEMGHLHLHQYHPMPTKVWQTLVDNLEEVEELECDPSRLQFSSRLSHWLALLKLYGDSLGLLRTDFPHTVCTLVAGTQAENPDWNTIGIFKVSNGSGKRRELVPTKATAGDS
ncbi:hypothetical protein NC653_018146 [Populus alba x Populus x berolinensis]|uniref:Uncharacterized protein n=1 Tax=Populus alba x Populus x berolinensis TaxID=444605 RepID=A0AAD6VUF7_9ROSI|nr:hypothetical protein NC653_018146 [Populus alba x Populus x berolinensis]